jgi:hypothetical protein
MASKDRDFLLNQWKQARNFHRAPPQILISNLGNLDGRNEGQENRLVYLKAALAQNLHICADVVYQYGAFHLVRPDGLEPLAQSFLANSKVWARAHDVATLDALCGINVHAFPHTDVGFTFTSAQFIWTHLGNDLSPRSIAVFPEATTPAWLDGADIAGICSNEPLRYR